MLHFYTPSKGQKSKGFLTFPGGIKCPKWVNLVFFPKFEQMENKHPMQTLLWLVLRIQKLVSLTPSLSISANWSEQRSSNNVSEPNIEPMNAPSSFKQFLICDNKPGKSLIQWRLKVKQTQPYLGHKVFKNGPRKICGKQPLNNLKGYGLPKADYNPVHFLKCHSSTSVFQTFC